MTTPCVGIFWFVSERGAQLLLSDKTPLEQAERYGECLTHPGGHAEFWEGLGRLGPRALAQRGLPTAPALAEYEEFPRGRVVFRLADERFVVYADRRLHQAPLLERLAAEFGLPAGRWEVQADSHYR